MKRYTPFLDNNNNIKRFNEIKNKRTENILNDICNDLNYNNTLNKINDKDIEIITYRNSKIFKLSPNITQDEFNYDKLFILSMDKCVDNDKLLYTNKNDIIFENYVWNNIASLICSINNKDIKELNFNDIKEQINNNFENDNPNIKLLLNNYKMFLEIYINNCIEIKKLKLNIIDNVLLNELNKYKINLNIFDEYSDINKLENWCFNFNIVIENCKNYINNIITKYKLDLFDFNNNSEIKQSHINFENDIINNNNNVECLFEPLKQYYNEEYIYSYNNCNNKFIEKLQQKILFNNTILSIVNCLLEKY